MLNEKEFKAMYEDFLESGLTVRDYCLNQGMTEGKFFYWQNKLKGVLPPKNGFVPVIFRDEQHNHSPQLPANRQGHQVKRVPSATGLTCEISYPNGISVRVTDLTCQAGG